MSKAEKSAYVTSQVIKVAEWLQKPNHIVSLPFEPEGIQALFAIPDNIGFLAAFKERDYRNPDIKKPFVTTFSLNKIEEAFKANAGISSAVPHKVIDNCANIFQASLTTGRPVGLLLPANTEFLSEQERSWGEISIDGIDRKTIGFMVPGGNEPHYVNSLKETGLDSIIGTSANFSPDYLRAQKSGHYDWGALIAQMSKMKGLCVFVPPGKNEVYESPSTTVVAVTEEGVGYINRRGSISDREIKRIFSERNIPIVGEVDNVSEARPYDYRGYNFRWGVRMFFLLALRNKDGMYIPAGISNVFEHMVLPPDARKLIDTSATASL